ncbi:hypothetical protein R3W88_010267 [Solanum pinnatisectum]|uniref:Uncharacterized protein n=1 Tax=Solanum pinnatisectum TaxID=50273 RepID=A0AAV9MDT9_9SOLN|nr:hypothetical protein R3W88_010267 [Solanum pinnatisectum]
MMELTNRAIQEYNERECNVFKYKVLKIEKVNFMVIDYFDYFMTVKVRNLTLVTPIETLQIHAGKRCRDGGGKAIYCCQPKGEKLKIFCNYLLMVRSICGAARPSTIPSHRSLAFLAKAGSAVLVSIGTSIPRMVANEVEMKPNSSPQTISMIIKVVIFSFPCANIWLGRLRRSINIMSKNNSTN